MALTRIKTNQLTDSSVTEGKIANLAVSGGKLANNLTYGSDLTVSGNLTVSGTTVAVATTNTRVDDALITLAQGTSGSPTEDSGLLIDRGSSDNVAFVWDESADEFVVANVGAEDGDTAGNLTISAYAGFHANAIVYASLNDGTTTVSSTAAELNLVDGSSAGTILNSKAVIYGSGGEVNATILQVGGVDITATPAEINVLDAVTAGTVAASKAVVVDANKDISSFRNLTASGVVTGGSFVIGSANISEAELETIDGITAGTAAASKAVILDGSKDIAGLNDVSAAGLTLSDLTDNRITIAGTSGILEDDANFTFDGTTLTVGGADSTVFTATVAGVVAASGAMTVDGLASLDGGINTNDDFTVDTDGNAVMVGLATSGIVNLNNTTESTSATTGALIVDGGVGIAKDLWVGIDLDVVGATTLDGAVTLGNASGDAITVTGTATFTPSADFDGGFTVAASQTLNMGANRVQAVADPSSAQDAATKAYVDSEISSSTVLAVAGDSGTDNVTVGTDTFTFSGTANEVTTAITNNTLTIGLPDDVTVGGNAIITGNLTVNGTTTTLSTTNSVVADLLIELGNGVTGTPANDAGLVIERGDSANVFIGWDESADAVALGTGTFTGATTGNLSLTAAALSAGAITSTGVVTATGFTIGSAVINEAELETIDGITAGTVAASKAVVVDANKDIASFRNLTASGVVTGGSLVIGSADMSEADLEKLDGITNGTGAANKAVVLGASNEISTGGVVTATGFTIGSAVISEAELETIDGITAGTAAASKAVVLDSSRNIATIGSITLDGSLIIGSASMSETDLEKLDGITNGTGAANKALVLGASNEISTGGVVTATGFTIGSAAINEAELETIDGVTAGTVAASKAVVVDANKDISSFRNLGATGETTLASAIVSDLTDNRITIAGASGALEDDANFTFDGTTFTVGGADSTVFSATVAGVVNIDGAATIDGLASLDGGINTNDDFTVDTDGNIVNVAITSSGLASLDGGIDVATAKFAVSTAGIVTTVEDIRITADNKQLEIGAGTDFTIGHDGTDTTITNATGILAINGAAASAIRVNEAGANVDFVVEGDTNTGLLTIDASQDNVGIGGAPNANAVLHVSSTGAMIIPVGTTAQRPTGVTGMLRYSSTTGGLEFYDNDSWESVSSEFTVATTEQFSGNGSTTAFTLQATAGGEAYSAAGLLVFINGVAQDVNAYALSGTGNRTMTLDEAPLSGDTIEVRKFTTTTTVTAIADTDGDTQIQVEEGSNDDTIRFDIAGSEKMTLTATQLSVTGDIVATGDITANGDITLGDAATDTITLNADIASNIIPDANNTRDIGASGTAFANVHATTFTGALTGDVTGNADTATALATARAIQVSGAVTGTANFDGSAAINIVTTNTADPTLTLAGDLSGSATFTNLGNATLTATIAANSVALSTDTTGNYVQQGATSGNGISGSVNSEGGTFTVTSNAVSTNTANTIVFRDGSGNFSAGTITGTATTAQYADLAEMYASDGEIAPGTVVCFAGEGKVVACDIENCRAVAGIISTDPAHLMNSDQEGVALALAGRVPCKVTGAVAAGDLMVAAGNGMAMANNQAAMGTVIGKAIEANEGGESVIEVLALMM